jgi:MtaA/CmuA family methyltransferase
MTGRERVVAMLEGRPVDRLPLMPITMMFAADLAGVPYGQYAGDHRVLAAAQILTATRFDFDYVSTISDPAREAADYGARVEWYDDQPPALVERDALLAEKSRLKQLQRPPARLGPRMEDRIRGIERLRSEIGGEKFIEGWVEGPCAEGADLRGINRLMLDFFDDPDFVRELFDFVIEGAIEFARPQIEMGADIIGIGDAAASLVGPRIYREFVWPFEKRLVDGIHAAGGRVRLHICGNTRRILTEMGQLGCEMVDLDSPSPVGEARQQMGPGQVLCGNLDPVAVLCHGTPESVTAAVAECHRQAGERYIVGAGCEIARGTPHGNVLALTEYARSHSPGRFTDPHSRSADVP